MMWRDLARQQVTRCRDDQFRVEQVQVPKKRVLQQDKSDKVPSDSEHIQRSRKNQILIFHGRNLMGNTSNWKTKIKKFKLAHYL